VESVQAFKLNDKPHHYQFVKDILSNIKADGNYLWRWIFGDEAMFYVLERVTAITAKYEDKKTLTPFKKWK
jgi:hypothetical protein